MTDRPAPIRGPFGDARPTHSKLAPGVNAGRKEI